MNKSRNLIPITVRADFKKNGEIIPLGITNDMGKTNIIDEIGRVVPNQLEKNLIEIQFYCKSNETWFWLHFIDKIWYIRK